MNLGNKILAACAFVGMLLSGCADDFTPEIRSPRVRQA